MSLLRKASIVTTPTAYENGKILSVKPVQSLSDELITNGDFATDSNWGKSGGATISGGQANIVGDGTSFTSIVQYSIFTIGKRYKVSVDVTINSGLGLKFQNGVNNESIGFATTSGTYVFYFTGTSGADFVIGRRTAGTAFNSSVNNVSVKEVIDADFDFTRNSSATRTNSQGLIEDITSDLPRIDYTGGEGHWLFEPQSTNTATYSNDFTQGDIFVASSDPSLSATVLTSQQATSPDGTNNAWKMVDNNDGLTGQTGFSYFNTTVISNNYNTISYFVKKQGSNNFVYINTGGFDTGAIGRTYFDIQNGTLGDVFAGHTANIENYGNGWYRISITMQTVTDIQGAFSLRLATSNGAGNVLRDGTNGVYFFGVQAESDANRQFMTSYIPTNAGISTRLADAAFGSGSSDLINSTEGVLYAEIAALTQRPSARRDIALSDGFGGQNVVRIQFLDTSDNTIRIQLRSGANIFVSRSTTVTDIRNFHKIAISYKVNEVKFYIDGVLEFTDTTANMPIGLDQLSFTDGVGDGAVNKFSGKTKCVAVFKEALTDAELTCLTTI